MSQEPRPKQLTSKELKEDLLRFVGQKFYADDIVNFRKDEARLLSWAILWPAGWLNGKGVTLSPDRYKQLFTDIVLEAVRHGATGKIKYRPAWLKMVIQSHFNVHGDEIYDEGKAARSQVEEAVKMAGKPNGAPAFDPVRELALAASILARSRKPSLKAPKAAVNMELKLS